MKITLKHPDCPDTYQIRPYKEGTCLELIKNPHITRKATIKGRTFEVVADRHPRYPWDLQQALKIAAEAMYMNPKCKDKPIEIDLSTESDKISKYFKKWIDKIVVEVEKDEE